MPFLRLTKSDMPHDHTTYFRGVFFADLPWKLLQDGREQTWVNLDVTITGQSYGIRRMRIDHDPARARNHAAPTTHLHYDHATRRTLEDTDLTGHSVRLDRKGAAYSLTIL